jgi:hypothetical protein
MLKVPRTGFEPAHSFEYHHLKVACLPISTPGQTLLFTNVLCNAINTYNLINIT